VAFVEAGYKANGWSNAVINVEERTMTLTVPKNLAKVDQDLSALG